MVLDTHENRKKCLCPKCPSFPSDCRGEVLYCGLGKSSCDINAKGCLCPGCLVYSENKLDALYYCTKDAVGDNKLLMRKKKSNEDENFYQTIVAIKDIAKGGKSLIAAMGSQKNLPFSFNNLHFVPAQIAKIPLNSEEKVETEIIIGPAAKKPLKVSSPIMISGLSFGAVSKKVKLIISQAAANLKIAYCSGEGGILPEELNISADYVIAQYATGRFGVTDKILKKAAAVEIRFGQGAYPGKGSYLPAKKMTAEIAKIRGLKENEAAYSPAHHPDMKAGQQIKAKVAWLRQLTSGVPIGAKIGCGNVEQDVKILVEAVADFIALDGFGGGTGATDYYVRENVGLPIIAALPRAVAELKHLKKREKITLIAGGGLRQSADFAKCLALGANAVYIGTAALIAINCEQYRVCQTGLCPTGVTTHNLLLLKQLDIEKGIVKLSNFISVSTQEITNLARIAGKNNINKLSINDLISLNKDLAIMTKTKWLGGKSNYK